MADDAHSSDPPLPFFPPHLLSQKVNDIVAAGGVTCPHCKTFLPGTTLGDILTATTLHGETADDGVCPARNT